MILSDRIYGKTIVKEPIITEIVKSPSFLRLKSISQFGVPDKYNYFQGYSRYEHSLGVMMLLRRLGATLEEQVAGLLHDVSHLAFSHVADWVFSAGRNGNEDLQDSLMEKFIRKSSLIKILVGAGFSLDRILEKSNFTLLERPIPDLCADRVDYALQEYRQWFGRKTTKKCLEGLTNFNGEIVFRNRSTAFLFASKFLLLQTNHWGSYESVIRYYLFSEMLKVALAKKIISKKDFFKDEKWVMAKLEKCDDQEITNRLAPLRQKDLSGLKRVSGEKVFKKFRYVDPKFIDCGKLTRLSEVSPKFCLLVKRHRKINENGIAV